MTHQETLDPVIETMNRLTRASLEMPVLGGIAAQLGGEAPLKGERIALCGHITEATSIQVRTLIQLGAEIAWCASSTSTTDDAIRDVMAGEVAQIFGKRGMSDADLTMGVDEVLSHWSDGPTLVLDEGARLIRALHSSKWAGLTPALAAEKTPEGIGVLTDMELRFPVLKSDKSIGKRLVDNPHGTSQSLLDTIIAITRGLMAGKTLLVCGYGRVGAGLAHKARGSGARVLIAETRPTRALVAVLNGYEVLPLTDALPQAQILCTVTGQEQIITNVHFDQLRDGAVLANGGHLPTEIDTKALSKAAAESPFAHGLTQFRFADGRTVYLIAGGHIANLSVGNGNPNEVMDATFSSQVLSLVMARESNLAPGLHPLPESSEAEAARHIAGSLGLDVTKLK